MEYIGPEWTKAHTALDRYGGLVRIGWFPDRFVPHRTSSVTGPPSGSAEGPPRSPGPPGPLAPLGPLGPYCPVRYGVQVHTGCRCGPLWLRPRDVGHVSHILVANSTARVYRPIYVGASKKGPSGPGGPWAPGALPSRTQGPLWGEAPWDSHKTHSLITEQTP